MHEDAIGWSGQWEWGTLQPVILSKCNYHFNQMELGLLPVNQYYIIILQLYCIVLYCTILYCILLYCTVSILPYIKKISITLTWNIYLLSFGKVQERSSIKCYFQEHTRRKRKQTLQDLGRNIYNSPSKFITIPPSVPLISLCTIMLLCK